MLDMHIRPSELVGINDSYLAFCFDEACAYIVKCIQDGMEPVIKEGKKPNGENIHVTKPSDIYNKYK